MSRLPRRTAGAEERCDDRTKRYHYHDFTRELSPLASPGQVKYRFASYPEADLSGPVSSLQRHDLDQSIHAAEKLAQIEYEEGVSATYFLLIHSPFYNLFERRSLRGAPHVRCSDIPSGCTSTHGVSRHRQQESDHRSGGTGLERRLAGGSVQAELRAFRFTTRRLPRHSLSRFRYAGLINCYAEPFRTVVRYCSGFERLLASSPLGRCVWLRRR